MASIYDSIKTAAELVSYVSVHGISTKMEDTCRAQDIFGHSTLEELDALANDNGSCNEKGEPDPNGTWGNGRKGTRDTFYSILFHIWTYEDAVRFWNQHTNPEHKQLEAERIAKEDAIANAAGLLETLNDEHNIRLEEAARAEKAEAKAASYSSIIYDREMTIMELKAEIYDLRKQLEMKGGTRDGE